jgi:hypothetical protein
MGIIGGLCFIIFLALFFPKLFTALFGNLFDSDD